MKVLHVNDYRFAGGAEVVMETTVSLLRARGLEAEVFTAQDVPAARRTPLSYIDSRACRRALAARLTSFHPQVVHLHNFYHILSPGILAVLESHRRRFGLSVVMTAHDYHLVCPNAGLFHVRGRAFHCADVSRLGSVMYLLGRKWDQRWIAVSMLKVAQHLWNYRLHRRRRVIDRVLCPSRFLEGVLSRCGLPTVHVPYPAPPAQRTSKPGGALRLVFAGRVEPEKGVAEFLQNFPLDFPGRLTVAGDGSQLQRCKAVCRQRGLDGSVEFTGRLPRDEVLSIVARSHVMVLPSRWVENHPMCLLEALASGTNILVCDLGGMREIVEGSGVGFVFAPDDPASLHAALGRVVEAFSGGTLNAFDASGFLGERNERLYTDRLIAAYRCQETGLEHVAQAAATA